MKRYATTPKLLAELGQRLRLDDPKQVEAKVQGYLKPPWYILYRLDTNQRLEDPIPMIEK